MTIMQDVRAAVPSLREALPDVRAAIPDLRDWTLSDLRDAVPDIREALPEARKAIPAVRESLADVRADLPGPWHRERPSIMQRIAIVVVAGVAVTVATWLLMAFLERRRLSRQGRAETDRAAVERAEGEGMGVAATEAVGMAPAMPPAATSHQTSGFGASPGIDLDTIRPLVGAQTSESDGGMTDGR
jgi:hypothetical protein